MSRPGSCRRFALLLLPLLLPAGAVRAEGVEWAPMTLDAALSEAASSGRMILIDVWAAHCGSCGQMDIDLWQTADGVALADGMIPLKIDSTSPQGALLRDRFPITGLPSILFVRSDGTEVDRIVGYTNKRAFLAEARDLKDGNDPLPGLEESLKIHPDSIPLMLPVFDRYLYRNREDEAKGLLARLLQLDPTNRTRQPEQALAALARQYTYVHEDPKQALDYWKTILERFPTSSSGGPAVGGALEAATSLGQVAWWREWICGILEKQPKNGNVQYAAAMAADRAGMKDARFAKAARTARALGVGGAFLDSVAVRLDAPPARATPDRR